MRFSPHFISTTYHNVQCVFFPMNQLYLLSSSNSAALVAHLTVGQRHFPALHFPVRTVRQCTHLSIVLSDCLVLLQFAVLWAKASTIACKHTQFGGRTRHRWQWI